MSSHVWVLPYFLIFQLQQPPTQKPLQLTATGEIRIHPKHGIFRPTFYDFLLKIPSICRPEKNDEISWDDGLPPPQDSQHTPFQQ